MSGPARLRGDSGQIALGVSATATLVLGLVTVIGTAIILQRTVNTTEAAHQRLTEWSVSAAESSILSVALSHPRPADAMSAVGGLTDWRAPDNTECVGACWRVDTDEDGNAEVWEECWTRPFLDLDFRPDPRRKLTERIEDCEEPEPGEEDRLVQRVVVGVQFVTGTGCEQTDDGVECGRTILHERRLHARGFVNYQLHFGSGQINGDNDIREPFVAGDEFRGPVHTNDTEILACNAVFHGGIAVGLEHADPDSGRLVTAEGCEAQADPPDQPEPVNGGRLDIDSLDTARDTASEQSTLHTGDLRLDLADIRSAATPDATSLPDDQTSVVVFADGDVWVRGTPPPGMNVAVVSGGDLTLAGNVNNGAQPAEIVVLAAENNVIVPPMRNDETRVLNNVGLIARTGAFYYAPDFDPDGVDGDGRALTTTLPSWWPRCDASGCPEITLTGALWSAHRGLVGLHSITGDTLQGARWRHEFPFDWPQRDPAWWPGLSGEQWSMA